jgi:hypothetical protein
MSVYPLKKFPFFKLTLACTLADRNPKTTLAAKEINLKRSGIMKVRLLKDID